MIKEYLILDKETQKRISNDQSNQNDSSYIQDNDYDYSTNLPKKKTIKQEDQVCLLKNKQAVQYQRSMEDLNYNFGKKRKLQSYRNVNNKENQKRQDNSLSILTRRFMKQIRSESDQTIDLNQVSIALGVQKRRIYDITNVLEGINYIKKVSKNKLKWIGPSNQEGRDSKIIAEIQELIQEEMILEKVICEFNEKIQDLLQQQQSFCYFNSHDIQLLGKKQKSNEKTIVIQLPQKSMIQIKEFQKDVKLNMEAPQNSFKNESFKKLSINTSSSAHFQSKNTGEINVYQICQIQSE
ncbi:hypothetical protein ABPG73_009870 [Tetrahymena malaccensis]